MGLGNIIKRGVRARVNFFSGGALDRRDADKMIKRASRDFDNSIDDFKEAQTALVHELNEYRELKKLAYTIQIETATKYLSIFRTINVKQRLGISYSRRTLLAEDKYGKTEAQLEIFSNDLEKTIHTMLGFVPILTIGAWHKAKKHLEDTTVTIAKLDRETEAIKLLSSKFKQGQEIILLTEQTVKYLILYLDKLILELEEVYKRLFPFGIVSSFIMKILPSFLVKKMLKEKEQTVIINTLNTTLLIAEIFKQVNIVKENNELDFSKAKMIESVSARLDVNIMTTQMEDTLPSTDLVDNNIADLCVQEVEL